VTRSQNTYRHSKTAFTNWSQSYVNNLGLNETV